MDSGGRRFGSSSSALRSQPPSSAAASYVGCKNRATTGVGVIGSAHAFVGQQEFPEFVAEVGGVWFNAVRGETFRLRVCVGVERALFAAAGPKAAAAEFARVTLSHHPVRAVRGPSRMQRGGPSGKSCTG